MQKIRQMSPWAMSAARALLGPVVILGDRCRWSPMTLAGLVATAFLSDVFDGVLARRWQVDTAAVRLCDTICDTIFYLSVGVALCLYQPQLLRGNLALLYVLLAVEAANFAANFAKFGKPASYHSYLAKSWGVMLAITITAGFITGHAVMMLRIALMMGIVSNMETIAMSLMLPVWRRDVKTIAAAWRIRKEVLGNGTHNAPASAIAEPAGRPTVWIDRGMTWMWAAAVTGMSLMATSAFASRTS